jgi:mannose-6-phosphate isomerase
VDGLNFLRVSISRGLSLDHRPPSVKVEKPWGRFEQYTHNLPCTVKIITVVPGGTLSRQYHHRRDELWVVLDPGARVELDGKILHPEPEEKLYIPRETVHRLSAAGDRTVRILEISFGEFDENDIVRLEDVYGRVGPG